MGHHCSGEGGHSTLFCNGGLRVLRPVQLHASVCELPQPTTGWGSLGTRSRGLPKCGGPTAMRQSDAGLWGQAVCGCEAGAGRTRLNSVRVSSRGGGETCLADGNWFMVV